MKYWSNYISALWNLCNPGYNEIILIFGYLLTWPTLMSNWVDVGRVSLDLKGLY